MKNTIALLSIATLGVISVPAQAGHNTQKYSRADRIEHHQENRQFRNRANRIEQRLENQRFRIRDGVTTGELTRKEAKRLRKQQRRIARLARSFMYDGYLDRYEFSELREKLNRASQRIYRLKHNHRVGYARHHY
jgi:hypothetical protein